MSKPPIGWQDNLLAARKYIATLQAELEQWQGEKEVWLTETLRVVAERNAALQQVAEKDALFQQSQANLELAREFEAHFRARTDEANKDAQALTLVVEQARKEREAAEALVKVAEKVYKQTYNTGIIFEGERARLAPLNASVKAYRAIRPAQGN